MHSDISRNFSTLCSTDPRSHTFNHTQTHTKVIPPKPHSLIFTNYKRPVFDDVFTVVVLVICRVGISYHLLLVGPSLTHVHTAFTPAPSLWFHHFQKTVVVILRWSVKRGMLPYWFSLSGEWGVLGSGWGRHSWAPPASVHLCQSLCSQRPSEQQSGWGEKKHFHYNPKAKNSKMLNVALDKFRWKSGCSYWNLKGLAQKGSLV